MADVTVTATSVLKTDDTVMIDGILAGTVTAGMSIYQDASGNWLAADANASALTANARGIAMSGGATGQPVKIATSGTINPGFTVTVGTWYIVSGTAGGIAPVADQVTGWRPCLLMVGTAADRALLCIKYSGVAVP